MAGFDGLVDVARGDGDRAGDRATGDHSLEAGGIGATCCEDFRLPFDFVALCGGLHELDHAVVADDGGVHELDGGPFAEGGAAFLWRGARDVVGDGGIEAESEVWLDFQSCSLGTAEADFFLDGENGVEVVGWLAFCFFQPAECLDEDKHGGAVVEGLHVHAFPDLHERRVAGHEISNGDVLDHFFFFEAGIDEVVGDFSGLVFLLRAHDVDGLGAHDAHDVLATVDDDALGSESFGIESADGIEADEAFVVDVGDDEADFVHVGGCHRFLGGGLAFFEGDDVAHVVDADVVGEAFELCEDEFSDFFFGSWGTWGFTNAGEQRDIDRHVESEITGFRAADEQNCLVLGRLQFRLGGGPGRVTFRP